MFALVRVLGMAFNLQADNPFLRLVQPLYRLLLSGTSFSATFSSA
jgi:hypothetical protein